MSKVPSRSIASTRVVADPIAAPNACIDCDCGCWARNPDVAPMAPAAMLTTAIRQLRFT
jgi:hypothetical protein